MSVRRYCDPSILFVRCFVRLLVCSLVNSSHPGTGCNGKWAGGSAVGDVRLAEVVGETGQVSVVFTAILKYSGIRIRLCHVLGQTRIKMRSPEFRNAVVSCIHGDDFGQ